MEEMLGSYVYKKVKITFVDGEIMVGEVTSYESAITSGEEYDCIDIICDDGSSYEVSEGEIKEIEVLEDDGTFEALFGKVG